MREGILMISATDRYEVDGTELTCGEEVQLRIGGYWIPARVEHNGMGYYFVVSDGAVRPDRIRVRILVD